jgi:hypothetical protein
MYLVEKQSLLADDRDGCALMTSCGLGKAFVGDSWMENISNLLPGFVGLSLGDNAGVFALVNVKHLSRLEDFLARFFSCLRFQELANEL